MFSSTVPQFFSRCGRPYDLVLDKKTYVEVTGKVRFLHIKVACRPPAIVGAADWGCSCCAHTSSWASTWSPGFLMLLPANDNMAGTLKQAYSWETWDSPDRDSEWSLLNILAKVDHSLRCIHQLSFSLWLTQSQIFFTDFILPASASYLTLPLLDISCWILSWFWYLLLTESSLTQEVYNMCC